MTTPLVSIVTPTYNQAEFLAKTIESVMAQSYRNIEYIVLDDGSSDSTPEVLARHRREGILCDRHANMGQTASINRGWLMARGEIVAWLNSDDMLTPNAVAEAVEALEAHPEALLVHGNCDNVDAEGRFLSRYPARQETLESLVFFENTLGIAQPSTFLRRRVLYQVGLLDPAIYWCMDLDYWMRVGLMGKIQYVDGPSWSHYRVHGGAKTSAQQARSAPDFVYVYEKLAANGRVPAGLQRRRREVRAHGHWLAARRYAYGRARAMARREAWQSLLLAPQHQTLSKIRLLLGRN